MVDRDRILAKLDDLYGYGSELRAILPGDFTTYMGNPTTRRAVERLLQISIECILDICNLLVAGHRLGLPSEEEDLFTKLETGGILSSEVVSALRSIRRFRNILVHEYGRINNQIVFTIATRRWPDLEAFTTEVCRAINN
jgi:uncharacterized protein YutE (UPF0331/DUF86 family)